jgi:hypothetical protein
MFLKPDRVVNMPEEAEPVEYEEDVVDGVDVKAKNR